MTDTLIPERIYAPQNDFPDPLVDPETSLFITAWPRSVLSFTADDLLMETELISSGRSNARYLANTMTFPEIDSDSNEDSPIPPQDTDSEESDKSSETVQSTKKTVKADHMKEPVKIEPIEPSTSVSDTKSKPATQPGFGESEPPDPPLIDTFPSYMDDEGDLSAESDSAYSMTTEKWIQPAPDWTPSAFEPEDRAEEQETGFLDYLIDRGTQIIKSVFGRTDAEPSYMAVYPGMDPPRRNSAPSLDPEANFSAGYISQRDLESALEREAWTMCCATTFVYATQVKYPELERDSIIQAVGIAADTRLADGSDTCVSDDGSVASAYQFSQAFARALDLDEYVDVSGFYSTVDEAEKDGRDMMKVEVSGEIMDETSEHHIFQAKGSAVDPIPDGGFSRFADVETIRVENVMSLDWYKLPEPGTGEIKSETES